MKVLVTGANGYIGTGVVTQLLNDGVEVIATDFKTSNVDKRATCIDANIFEMDDPYHKFDCPDALVHLAWRDGFKHGSEAHIVDLPKHYDFLKKLITAGIKQVCVMGSMHEVGFFEGAINESTPTKPQSLYGIGKNALRDAAELLAKENGTIFQWTRGYYIVGNSSAGCSIFSKITQAEKEGKVLFPFTMGTNQYDFIDYTTFCEQVAAVVEQTDVTGVINCCSGYPMPLKERVEKFIKDNNYAIRLQYGAFPDRPYDSKAVWGDDFKIRVIMKERNEKKNG